MTGTMYRFALAVILAVGLTVPGFAQERPSNSAPLPGGTTADAAALRQLTAQLGSPTGTPNITPELIELAMKMYKSGLIPKENLPQYQEQLSKLSPEQLAQIKTQVQQQVENQQNNPFPKLPLNPGEFQLPPPNPGMKPPVPPEGGINPTDFPPGVPLGQDPNPRIIPTVLPRPQPITPANLPNNPAAKDAIEFWEKNIGSLNGMPAVRDALIALATSGLENASGDKPFWNDLLKDMGDEAGSGSSASGFFKWLNDNAGNLSISSDKLAWAPPATGWNSSGGSTNFTAPSTEGIGTVGIIVLSTLGLAALILFFWKVLPAIQQTRTPKALPGLGPWPIDPREIQTRPQLILAFEYLSVLECGERARTWNHVTIANGLRALVPQSAPFASELARVYALARYTPESEAISEATLIEARGYLCRLAGVSRA